MGAQNPSISHKLRTSKEAVPPPFSPAKPTHPADLQLHHWLRVSWSRSRAALGETDEPSASYVEQVPTDSVLTRAANPVLSALSAEIDNEPVSLILSDGKGTVLSRYGGDKSLLTALDRVDLAPGFRYAESQMGTNGIGTALEVGTPLVIEGSEHFSGPLRAFSCAGALVTHPLTGAILGVVDLTTKTEHTNPLLLSFAKLAAARIKERILDDANEHNRAVLSAYHAVSHSGQSVIAVGDEVLMINTVTQQQFDSHDQSAIIDRIRDTRGQTKPFTALTDLPSGATARLSYQPTFVNNKLAGGIVRITEQLTTRTPHTTKTLAMRTVAGSSAGWRRTVSSVVDACSRNEWLVLDGESGVGKYTLIRAAHEHISSSHRLAILDAATLGGEDLLTQTSSELENGSDIAVLHAHTLSDNDLTELGQLLQEVEQDTLPRKPWVALTMHQQEPSATSSLLRLFPKSISVPPLRYHLEDIPDLVKSLLRTVGATHLTLSPASLNQLTRLAWRGNVTHLRSVLEEIHRHRRSGVVEPEALPAECRATTWRNLTKLQSLERDAIVDALALHCGDKTAAAQALGMSRATIYRKIREFGIVYKAPRVPPASN
ncbi:helix-turn-helix domain-containing protein [Rhodococcus sp. IEGM 1379]|uniref:sigma-54-dependent Fis family transcriptional regulator n=1 Tax=Rhodococcus sp. IEGM 1379 TaxID=3047086 RepID=UPI0024B866A6|nr:helix-turn-helix domain-containing protein [Rhodococcus sp. IEGM 1379]MDI9918802.1 helix-turn-helix domain-containing protein [Rhodococcus sp. IEGM 1379]